MVDNLVNWDGLKKKKENKKQADVEEEGHGYLEKVKTGVPCLRYSSVSRNCLKR